MSKRIKHASEAQRPSFKQILNCTTGLPWSVFSSSLTRSAPRTPIIQLLSARLHSLFSAFSLAFWVYPSEYTTGISMWNHVSGLVQVYLCGWFLHVFYVSENQCNVAYVCRCLYVCVHAYTGVCVFIWLEKRLVWDESGVSFVSNVGSREVYSYHWFDNSFWVIKKILFNSDFL